MAAPGGDVCSSDLFSNFLKRCSCFTDERPDNSLLRLRVPQKREAQDNDGASLVYEHAVAIPCFTRGRESKCSEQLQPRFYQSIQSRPASQTGSNRCALAGTVCDGCDSDRGRDSRSEGAAVGHYPSRPHRVRRQCTENRYFAGVV